MLRRAAVLLAAARGAAQLDEPDCGATAALMTARCCERTPELCGAGGGTPSQCTAECSPAFVDFWMSSCHDSVLEGGADFQADLDRLLDQCVHVSDATSPAAAAVAASAAPEMVHLSHAGAGAEYAGAVVVTWQTATQGLGSDVGFRALGTPGAGWSWTSANGAGDTSGSSPQRSTYTGAGRVRYRSGAVHRVLVRGLRPGVQYTYRVGDRRLASDPASSDALSPELGPYRHHDRGGGGGGGGGGQRRSSQKIVIVGDLGQSSASDDTLRQIAALQPDLVQLNGDLAYANGVESKWDSWQRLMQPIASRIPTMVAAGNHDMRCTFPPRVGGSGWCNELSSDAYRTRFTMPEALDPVSATVDQSVAEEAGRNFFFSYDAGLAHVVVLCPYVLWGVDSAQYRWAAADLAAVDRSVTPWLIVISHAPFYTSNLRHQTEGRLMLEIFEGLFIHYAVDAVATGHIHAYERTAPVSGGLLTGTVDPNGAVHLTVGCGGNAEGLYTTFDPRGVDQYPWMAGGYREAAYGYGELEIYNSSLATWRWHKLVPRFGSRTGGSQIADEAAISHPPRAQALIEAAAAAAAGATGAGDAGAGAGAGAGCVVRDACSAEMRGCEASDGCHPVWACMGSSLATEDEDDATAPAPIVGLCGEDSVCAQRCFGFGDPSGGMELAALAMCAQPCLEQQQQQHANPNPNGAGGGH